MIILFRNLSYFLSQQRSMYFKMSRKYRLTESVTNAGCISNVSKKMVDVTLDIILLSYQSFWEQAAG